MITWYRTKLVVFISVVWAIFSREIRDKVFEYGIVFLFSPLIVQLAVQLAMYYAFNRQTIMGMNKVVFIISGFMPYLLFERTLMENAAVYMQIKNSLAIKQVKVFDAILANCITWYIICIIVYFLSLLIACIFFNIDFKIYYLLNIFLSLSICFVLSLGLSLIAAVFGIYAKTSAVIWTYGFAKSFYLASGIFFPLSAVPFKLRGYFLLNPMLHLTELDRYAFLATNVRDEVNFIYPAFWALGCLFMGMVCYLYFKDVFLKKAFE